MITREQYRRRLAAHWEPPGDICASEWADRNMVLSPETSAKPGEWRTRSYQRQPLDAISNPAVRILVLNTAVQMVKTSLMKIAAAYTIAVDPKPIMALFPRKEDARDFGDDHMVPMIRDVKALQSRAKLTRMGKAPRAFRGGRLYLTSAGSAQNVGGKAVGLLLADEVNKYVSDVDEEGNPLTLALQRGTTFANRFKAVMACSPTTDGGAISQWWERSQQHDFYVPCPACGTWQTMYGKFFSQVKFDDQLATREEQALTARYHCENKECDAAWDDAMRQAAVERGEYRTTQPFTGVVGYRVSQLCSLDKQLSQIVLEFLRAKDTPLELKAFINTTLAETWVEQGEAPEWERLLEGHEAYAPGTVPRGGLVLVGGVDVQDDRLELEVVAYGRNRESWSVAYEIFEGRTDELVGQPGKPSPWEKLQATLAELYPVEGTNAFLPISRLFVDSGYQTNTVYQWVRMQPDNRVLAIKGVTRGNLPVSQPKPVDVTIFGRVIKSGLRIRDLLVDFFKSELYADLRKKKPTEEQCAQGWTFPQGYCHFPTGKNYGDEHFKQLCAEQLVTVQNKRNYVRREWQKMRPRNEALDVRVYARAAAWDYGIDRFQERHWKALEAQLGPQQEGFELTVPVGVAPRPMVSEERPEMAPARLVAQAAARQPAGDWLGGRGRDWF